MATPGWKPVNLSTIQNKARAVSGSGFSRNTNWYNEIVQQASGRIRQLDQYDQMDNITVDVSKALDIIAEDISSSGADDYVDFEVDFPEGYDPKKTEMRTLSEMIEKWKLVTGLDCNSFDYFREMIKYGAVFFRKNPKDSSLSHLNPRFLVGYRHSKDDPGDITHYLYDPSYSNDGTSFRKKEPEAIPVEDLLILSIGGGPFGESVLAKVYRTWKQMQLLEDAVVIYRIVRAPERRVFYVDIGRLNSTKAEQYLQRFQSRLKQKQQAKSDDITTAYNPQSMTEDFFMAVSGDSRGSRVETLPGGDSVGNITDLTHFNKKLAMGLRVPSSYMESTWSENGEQAQFNDGRLGMAYQSELRYVGYAKRIQKKITKILRPHFIEFCKKNGVEPHESMIFKLSPPQSFAEYRKNELFAALVNTAVSAEQVKGMSGSFVMEKFMDFDKTDIEENEYRMLLEKGFSKQDQSKLSEEIRYNIIYGDGSLNPKGPDETDNGFGGM